VRRLKRREEEISARIEAIAVGKARLQEELAHPNTYINGEKTRRILADLETLDQEAECLNQEWLEIAESLAGEVT
jgi:hypothetical protein